MGLIRNNLASGNPGRFYGAAQGAFAFGMGNVIQNAACFGSITSVPQGYTDSKAIKITVKTGGNISARVRADLDSTADVTAIGHMDMTLTAEAYATANANVGLNGYATCAGEFGVTADMTAIGSMEAKMDLLARPSANDIAQEVWNAKTSAFQSAGTLGKSVSDAESAAKLSAALSA